MIYDWSREKAHTHGNYIAVTLGDEHLNYADLESESNRLAGLLLSSGLEPGARVGLYMKKTPKALIAILGILKAGGVYVPLDYKSPATRVSKIIKASDPSFIFIDPDTVYNYQDVLFTDCELNNISWVWMANSPVLFGDDSPPVFGYEDLKSQPDIAHKCERGKNTAAQILFTSGSTGEPKGVVITHKNIMSFISWAASYFNMNAGDRTACHSPLHFDLSTFDIFGAFASGSHLYLVPAEISISPKKLADFILHNSINQWFSVPSALSYLARFKAIPAGGFPNLKRLIWCGEVFPVPALQYWMKKLPHAQFTNMYGPTEATIASSFYPLSSVPGTFDEIPIGTACKGENLMVLNRDMSATKTGKTGNLYISGDGLSPGYWNDPDKTNDAFCMYTNTDGTLIRIYKTGDLAMVAENGLIYFKGRADYQIKSRGYRIELGEIEAALSADEALKEYAVVPVNKRGFEGTSIGCAYVGGGIKNGDLAIHLKNKLLKKIPGYMIPHFWQEYDDSLPRNGNGKIDRRRLADEFESPTS
ncbi:MAG: amino acid adenylation domain-containing protein [Balneolales bacterium]|nr:amino acid adenylation domain-containing protein [Balneolales bacterium]